MNKLYKSFIAIAACMAFGASAQIVNPPQPGGPAAKPQTFTNHGILVGQGTSNVVATAAGTSGQCLISGGASADPAYGSCSTGSGTVLSVSVVSANGLAGTVATATTTPAITLSTSITGILKGNGTAISAATSSTDYAPATTGTSILKASSGGFANAVAGTDYAAATSGSAILYGDGAGGFSSVTVGSGLSFSGGTLLNTAAGTLTVVPNYIGGFGLSNDGTTPTTKLDVAAGFASDSTNAVMITGTAFIKTVSGSWVSGSGNAGMGTGLTVANNTWYHVYAIINAGNFDVYFDTSATAANKPASTTAFRYVGSFKTNGSAQIVAFKQLGQSIYYAAQVTDLSNGTATTPTLVTLTVPTGFNVYPMITASSSGGANNEIFIWSPSSATTAPTEGVMASNTVGDKISGTFNQFITNTSGQIYYDGTANPALAIYTTGYINPHIAPTF